MKAISINNKYFKLLLIKIKKNFKKINNNLIYNFLQTQLKIKKLNKL